MIEINGLMVGILLCDPLKFKIKNLPLLISPKTLLPRRQNEKLS